MSEFQDRTFTFNQTYDDPLNLSGPTITIQRTVQGNDEINNMSMDPNQMTRNIILLVCLSVAFRLYAPPHSLTHSLTYLPITHFLTSSPSACAPLLLLSMSMRAHA